jgi:hypothetical protein
MSERDSDPLVTIEAIESSLDPPSEPTLQSEPTIEVPVQETAPSVFEQLGTMSTDIALRQRDEAMVRIVELEHALATYEAIATDNARMRELLHRIATIVGGVPEFESLERVVANKMMMLETMLQKEILDGIREASRIAAAADTNTRIRQLEEEIERLKARK